MCGCLSPTPGKYLDGEWNQRPFCLQPGTQSTQPHQPGCKLDDFWDGEEKDVDLRKELEREKLEDSGEKEMMGKVLMRGWL